VTIDPGTYINKISCPSVSLCVAVDGSGGILTSTNPTGGATAWTRVDVDGSTSVWGVSCASVVLCVAVDADGGILTSTNPAGGASAWTRVDVDGSTLIWAVSCPSASLCVAGDEAGEVLSSTNPTGGIAAWQASAVGQGGIGVISCAGITVCVAGDATGQLLSSSSPSAGSPRWSVTSSDPGHWMAGLTCTKGSKGGRDSLCVATDSAGDVLTNSNPAKATSTWTTADVNGTNVIWDVSCPVTTLCAAGDVTGSILWAIPTRPVVTKVSPASGPTSSQVQPWRSGRAVERDRPRWRQPASRLIRRTRSRQSPAEGPRRVPGACSSSPREAPAVPAPMTTTPITSTGASSFTSCYWVKIFSSLSRLAVMASTHSPPSRTAWRSSSPAYP
jgi:hypothetical protein